ncbi:MAG: hypothetical protein PF487_14800 [Bacteroidales bacterium]|jgi:hypothetical protein|nr:hypothetical protein [Bacteroidales bacterium]
MGKKKNIKLTEIFTAKAGRDNKGFDRCFHGIINRDVDEDGNLFVFSKITVNDGYIIARGTDQWDIRDKLDELVMLILDHDLHKTDCVTAINPKFKFELKQIYMN